MGKVTRDPKAPNRFNCEVLDYCPFPTPVSFKNERDEYLETGAHRRGYFQPGVRTISEEDFGYIIEAGQIGSDAEAGAAVASSIESKETPTPGYASPTTLRTVEDFAVRVALDEIHQRFPLATIEPQHRNNPGFDILVRPTPSGKPIYVEVKGVLPLGLQLCGDEAGGPAVAKVATHGGSPLEPAGDGVPGQPFDPGNRRQTDPLDAQRDDTVERRSAMLEAVRRRAFRRRERLSAPDAPVATPFPGCGSVESVADDACGLDVSVQRTRGVETAWFLHCASLVDESTEALKCRPKL